MLEHVKQRVMKDLMFDQWLVKTQLSYYTNMNLKELKAVRFEKLDLQKCWQHLQPLDKKNTPAVIEQAVSYNWANCANHLYQRVSSEEANEAWKKIILSEKCDFSF